jgi:hypothetical protein
MRGKVITLLLLAPTLGLGAVQKLKLVDAGGTCAELVQHVFNETKNRTLKQQGKEALRSRFRSVTVKPDYDNNKVDLEWSSRYKDLQISDIEGGSKNGLANPYDAVTIRRSSDALTMTLDIELGDSDGNNCTMTYAPTLGRYPPVDDIKISSEQGSEIQLQKNSVLPRLEWLGSISEPVVSCEDGPGIDFHRRLEQQELDHNMYNDFMTNGDAAPINDAGNCFSSWDVASNVSEENNQTRGYFLIHGGGCFHENRDIRFHILLKNNDGQLSLLSSLMPVGIGVQDVSLVTLNEGQLRSASDSSTPESLRTYLKLELINDGGRCIYYYNADIFPQINNDVVAASNDNEDGSDGKKLFGLLPFFAAILAAFL